MPYSVENKLPKRLKNSGDTMNVNTGAQALMLKGKRKEKGSKQFRMKLLAA